MLSKKIAIVQKAAVRSGPRSQAPREPTGAPPAPLMTESTNIYFFESPAAWDPNPSRLIRNFQFPRILESTKNPIPRTRHSFLELSKLGVKA